jgi:hypothetical protein
MKVAFVFPLCLLPCALCLILRPHSSEIRPAAKPAGWTFSIRLKEAGYSTVS